MRITLLSGAAIALLAAAPASGSELSHRVGAGETLEAVAKAYYGAAWKAVYLRSRNEIGPDAGDLLQSLFAASGTIYNKALDIQKVAQSG